MWLSIIALCLSVISIGISIWFRHKDEIESRPYIDIKIEFGTDDGCHVLNADGSWTVSFTVKKISIINYGRGTARNLKLEMFGSESPDTQSKHIIFRKEPMYFKYILPTTVYEDYVIDNERWSWLRELNSPTYIFFRLKYEHGGKTYGGKDNEDGLIKWWDDNPREKTFLKRIN